MTNNNANSPLGGDNPYQNNGGYGQDNSSFGQGSYGQDQGSARHGQNDAGFGQGDQGSAGDSQPTQGYGQTDQGYSQPTQGYQAFPNAAHHNSIGLQQGGVEYPGAGSRFLAFFLDSIVTGIITSIIVWLGFQSQIRPIINGEATELPWSVKIASAVLGLLVWYAYRVTMEAKAGGSLGRMATGTRVIKANGEPIDFATAAKRNIFYPIAVILNLIPIIGFLLQFVFYIAYGVSISKSPTKQSFTDKSAPALVVKK